MADVLEQICEEKRRETARRQAARPLAEVMAAARAAPPPRGFARQLRAAAAGGGYGLIAEIKRASPSRGLIRADYSPPDLARAYARGGATCLSVLTDGPYFQGRDADLVAARTAVPLPALRKDFMLEAYQIAESRMLGADCVLLILAALDDATAARLADEAQALGMDVLVEVHDRAELDRALLLSCQLIGINNRNLKTLSVDVATTEKIATAIPNDRVAVSESGLKTPSDLARMAHAGVRCFLVGESLMLQPDVEAATRTLLAGPLPVPFERAPV
ncbi:MAG TPA: indole-3-glycerol phosphate synthase TrpC [Candidatus Sulfotelmatobacter sp.]|nr:indole-3-glycerol phosphate synthase TrpC [Candidatus Sulfotelmatobacter sp.]